MIKSGITSGLSSSSRSGLLLPEHKIIPSQLPGLKLWCRYGQGITVTGSGVSQWDDQSGNGNHLKQATDANRMTKEADGSVLGNGVDQFLKADSFTLLQPEMIYILGKQVTWTANDRIFDGNAVNTGLIFQTGTTPNLTSWGGGTGASTTELALDTYGVITTMFDHDSALNIIQIDDNAPITDTAFGTADMNGFTLGAGGDNTNFSNIQIKEVLIYSAAHNAAINAGVIRFLQSI